MARFVEESLATLRHECPTAYVQLCTLLKPREVLMLIDSETITLTFDHMRVHILPQLRRPTLSLQTTRQTILDVVDDRLRINEAVLVDAILLQGDVDDLALFYEGLLTYVRGAIRCPTFPALLERFRQGKSGLLHRDDEADTW
jgi:hypothetical protein